MRSSPVLERFRRHRAVAGLIVLGFLCRALIPVGFMPAAIGAGGPFAVCHGGLAGELFRQLAVQSGADASDAAHQAHAGHDGHAGHALHDTAEQADDGAVSGDASGGAHEAWDHCPVGAAFGAVAIGAAFEFSLPVLQAHFVPAEPAPLLHHQFVSSYRARAPPAHPPLV